MRGAVSAWTQGSGLPDQVSLPPVPARDRVSPSRGGGIEPLAPYLDVAGRLVCVWGTTWYLGVVVVVWAWCGHLDVADGLVAQRALPRAPLEPLPDTYISIGPTPSRPT